MGTPLLKLATVFGMAAAVAAPGLGLAQQQPTQPGNTTTAETGPHTYWQYRNYGAYLDIWRCGKEKLCGQVHSLDPKDSELRHRFGQMMHVSAEQVSETQIMKFCGFKPVKIVAQETSASQGEPGHWTGYMITNRKDIMPVSEDERLHGKHINFEITSEDGGKTLHIYIPHVVWIIPLSLHLHRVANPPPACHAPTADKPQTARNNTTQPAPAVSVH